ncbi:FAD-dependent oxidoreductase [Methanococcoides orientis]|uniref:FAD-dependent oxidoreductase n=1 Tax=Methanococcoides orientis TaxID=2822137 RepID=UPI00217546D9|nr:FAD-dependent oxidoreductase [Methanococcoides orientis]UGV41560.1 FAD-dependent oxidoreductase [Methanococcoides orientis]
MTYERLFEPCNIGTCNLMNRVIMAPMGNINMADPTGRPTNKMVAYFKERAKGGTGLLITGLVPVSFGIDPTVSEDNDTTYFPRIDGTSRTRLSGWRDLTSAVKPFGSKIFIQLSAGLGRVGSPEPALKGKILRSASFNRNFYVPQIPHFPLSDRKIRKIVKSFGQCAVNAKVSGFDGVQIHGHEGYLMDQLTSDPWNRRKIGRYRNKFQFGIDVVKEIKRRCGDDFPIIYRIDLTQALEESYGQEIFKKQFRGKERKIEEGLEFCKVLYEAGVDAFDVDKGCYDNWFWPHPPAYFDDAIYAEELAGRLRSYFQKENINAKVIAVGKLGKPEVAEKVLDKGWADFVMLGRPLLADPYWTRKVKEGRTKEIVHCIGDQEGCIESFKMGGHSCCTVNPYMGFEDCKKLTRADVVKRIAVIGAGPAGCEAAMTAHKRGHDVTIFEKNDHIGGQLHLAGKMMIKHDIRRYLENLHFQLELLIKDGLKVEFNKAVTPGDVNDHFDVILCCTGLETSIPDIEGLESIPHEEIREFLKNDLDISDDVKDVLVVGGGILGCEVGYSLAYEKGLNVAVVGKNKDLIPKTVMANRSQMLWMMMGKGSPSGKKDDLLREPITAYNTTEVIRFSGNKAYLSVNKGKKAPYTPWKAVIPENVHNPFEKDIQAGNVEEIQLNADLVLFATSGKPNNSLYYQLLKDDPSQEIYALGDSSEPGNLWKAITNANEVARNI